MSTSSRGDTDPQVEEQIDETLIVLISAVYAAGAIDKAKADDKKLEVSKIPLRKPVKQTIDNIQALISAAHRQGKLEGGIEELKHITGYDTINRCVTTNINGPGMESINNRLAELKNTINKSGKG